VSSAGGNRWRRLVRPGRADRRRRLRWQDWPGSPGPAH